MIRIPRVKNAVFGLPLVTGTKIIAILHLVLYSLFFTVISVKEKEHEEDSSARHNFTQLHNATVSNSTGEEDYYEDLETKLIHESFLKLSNSYYNDFALLIQMTFAALLLLGIYQENLDFIMSWVLLQIANMIYSLLFVVIYFVALFYYIYGTNYVQYLICEEITITLVVGYCVIVVNSYVEEATKKTEDREEQLSPIAINSTEDRFVSRKRVPMGRP